MSRDDLFEHKRLCQDDMQIGEKIYEKEVFRRLKPCLLCRKQCIKNVTRTLFGQTVTENTPSNFRNLWSPLVPRHIQISV